MSKNIHINQISDIVSLKCIEASLKIRKDIELALKKAFREEKKFLPKEFLRIILKNLEIAKKQKIPLCQDTGMLIAFVEIGNKVHLIGGTLSKAINEGVRKGYKQGYLRASIVKNPIGTRINTNDNTPCIIHSNIIKGDKIKIRILPKGFGAENMSRLVFLKPGDGINGVKKFVLDTVCEAGSNPCPPTIIGIGIGGDMMHVAYLAKKALLRRIDKKNKNPEIAKLEQELFYEINKLNIGVQGLGGSFTTLGVNIETFSTHIAGLPVAVNLSCYALRYAEAII